MKRIKQLEMRFDFLEDDESFSDWYLEQKSQFMDEYVVFVEDDGTDLYHKYNCSLFVKEYFWAFNVDAAKKSGYSPCQQCHN